jgi:hypothetical protein
MTANGGEGYSAANRTTIQKAISLSSDDAQEFITVVSTGGTTTSITLNGATVDIGRSTSTSGRRPVIKQHIPIQPASAFQAWISPGVNITNAYIKFRQTAGPIPIPLPLQSGPG